MLDDRTDPAFIARCRPVFGWFYDHYFRVELHQPGNAPLRPSLIVANHNGILGAEVLMILEAWLRHTPREAPRVLGLTHDYAIRHPAFRFWLPKLGAIPAKRELALEALKNGYSVLVYPGGDRDAFRPYAERAKVDFGGRTGYARLALEAGVPIVPLVNVGGHEQAIVLSRSDSLPRILGLDKRLRIHSLPITLRGLPFLPGLFSQRTEKAALVAMFAAATAPLPAKMDFYFEPALMLSDDDRQMLSFEEQVVELDLRTRRAIQARLSEEYAKPRIPIWGKARGAA